MKGSEKTPYIISCEEEKSPERSGDFSFYIEIDYKIEKIKIIKYNVISASLRYIIKL